MKNTLNIENFSLKRLTALWAFSESVLGGLLHALHIPFSGVVLTSLAVIFISLISISSQNKSDILKSLAIVISVKFAVSPYSPFGAYVSVVLQGLTGFAIFSLIRKYFLSAIIFSVMAMLISSLQKIIIYTILFGYQVVDSINVFLKIATEQIPILKDLPHGFNFTLFIVGLYLSIYFLAGIVLGFIVYKLPSWLETASKKDDFKRSLEEIKEEVVIFNSIKKKKKKKLIIIAIFVVVIFLLIFSYFFPQYEELESTKLLLVLVRAIFILIIWYFFIFPIFTKFLKSRLNKSKAKYATEIDEIIELFPLLKKIFHVGWNSYKGSNFLKRTKHFLIFFILAVLINE